MRCPPQARRVRRAAARLAACRSRRRRRRRGGGLHVRRVHSPGREKELSLYKKTKRAIASKKYSVSRHEAEATTPIELISRGPDGRFVMDPDDAEGPVRPRRIEGFPFVEESDLYPEFRQSDEENDDPGPMPPIMPTLRPHQISPMSSSQESYAQPPAYSPRFQRPVEGMTVVEGGRLQAVGQSRVGQHQRLFPHGHFYGYHRGSPGEPEFPPPFYMPDISPHSSIMSSPPPFGYPAIPEEGGEGEGGRYVSATTPGSTLPLSHALPPARRRSGASPISPSPAWRGRASFSRLTTPCIHTGTSPSLPPPPSSSSQISPPSSFPFPSYPVTLPLESLQGRPTSPGKPKPHGPPSSKRLAMQEAQSLGQLRHTSQGLGVPVLPYPDPAAHRVSPSAFGGLDTRWYEPQARLSPRAARRLDPSLHQVVLQPSRLSPLAQSPPSSTDGSPEIVVRPRPRPAPPPARPARRDVVPLRDHPAAPGRRHRGLAHAGPAGRLPWLPLHHGVCHRSGQLPVPVPVTPHGEQ
ncbi:hypothetical protein AAFF_G00094820 [Aldrovandia affinis]|uniref:Uncharacterized protein n=1 Tax=Aldrovandia affinis TaxID=143900 RepID=A0AAD7WC76_9TELE|nr:hypothetical protein AAFF_G00094820 [Aldrovandia affinis]